MRLVHSGFGQRLLLPLCCAIVQLGLVACSFGSPTGSASSLGAPTPDTHSPPVYPGAQHVQVLADLIDGRIIEYEVDEPPTAIAKYYKDLMQKSGWSETPTASADELEFGLIIRSPNRSSSTFSLRVALTQEKDNLTKVRARMYETFPH